MMPPSTDLQTLVTALALAAGIILTRAVPFLLFAKSEELPPVIVYLGGCLPHASMAMLLVYCLKNVSPFRTPHGLPEAVAIAVTALIHLWKNNAILSIAGGTICYMLLVQRVFG